MDLCDDAPRRMNFLRRSIEEWILQMLDHADRLLNTQESFKDKPQIEHFKDMAVQEVRTLATRFSFYEWTRKAKENFTEPQQRKLCKVTRVMV